MQCQRRRTLTVRLLLATMLLFFGLPVCQAFADSQIHVSNQANASGQVYANDQVFASSQALANSQGNSSGRARANGQGRMGIPACANALTRESNQMHADILTYSDISAREGSQAYASVIQGALPQEQEGAEDNPASSDASSEIASGYRVYRTSGQDVIEAQTNQTNSSTQATVVTIRDFDVPLSGAADIDATMQGKRSGSFLNVALVMLCLISVLAMIRTLSRRKAEDYRITAARAIVAGSGLIVISTWSLLDGLQAPAVFVSDSSVLIVALFCVHVAVALVAWAYTARIRRVALEAKDNDG